MKDYGCGATLIDGMPCTTLDDSTHEPFLCDQCTTKLVERLELLEYHLARIMMSRWHQRADKDIGLGLNISIQEAGKLFKSVKECEDIVSEKEAQ